MLTFLFDFLLAFLTLNVQLAFENQASGFLKLAWLELLIN